MQDNIVFTVERQDGGVFVAVSHSKVGSIITEGYGSIDNLKHSIKEAIFCHFGDKQASKKTFEVRYNSLPSQEGEYSDTTIMKIWKSICTFFGRNTNKWPYYIHRQTLRNMFGYKVTNKKGKHIRLSTNQNGKHQITVLDNYRICQVARLHLIGSGAVHCDCCIERLEPIRDFIEEVSRP